MWEIKWKRSKQKWEISKESLETEIDLGLAKRYQFPRWLHLKQNPINLSNIKTMLPKIRQFRRHNKSQTIGSRVNFTAKNEVNLVKLETIYQKSTVLSEIRNIRLIFGISSINNKKMANSVMFKKVFQK